MLWFEIDGFRQALGKRFSLVAYGLALLASISLEAKRNTGCWMKKFVSS